jgi:hypothetical protein
MTEPFDADLRDRLTALAGAVPIDPPDPMAPVRPRLSSGSTSLRLAWTGLVPVLAVVVVGTIVAGLARVGPFAPGASQTNGPVSTTVTNGPFELTLRSSTAHYAPGEAIHAEASLTYRGVGAITIWHARGSPDGGPLGFGVVEPVLGGLEVGPFWRQSCRPSTLDSATPITSAYTKSGGFTGDDPRAAQYEAFFADPVLRLDEGAWHLYAVAEFSVGDCSAAKVELRAQIEIVVDAGMSPSPTADNVIHVVNLDSPTIEVLSGDRILGTIGCHGSTVIKPEDVASGTPWSLDVRVVASTVRQQVIVDGPLPRAILFRDGVALTGPWPMSDGPAPVATCPVAPSESSSAADPVVGTDAVGDYSIEIRSDRATYRESDLIEVSGMFRYAGQVAKEVSGLKLGFGILEPVYGMTLQPIFTAECAQTLLQPGDERGSPFVKMGGVSGSDPRHDEQLAYFKDPEFRLPPGTWHLRYVAFLYAGSCGTNDVALTAQIEITVLPDH